LLALGISQDLYGSGAAFSDGRHILFAANEERFSRTKNVGGYPSQCIERGLAHIGGRWDDITHLAVCGIMTPPLPLRVLPDLQRRFRESQFHRSEGPFKRFAEFVIEHTPVAHGRPGWWLSRLIRPIVPWAVRLHLPHPLAGREVAVIEHHRAHAACAYHLSGFDDALIVTSDGMGDGVSISVSVGRAGKIERLDYSSSRDSVGAFFERLTEGMGFIPNRDEGKLTGLAGSGDSAAVTVPSPFNVSSGRVHYTGPRGLDATHWVNREITSRFRREDIAAWGQAILEQVILGVTAHWLKQTGLRRVTLAGGTFANVRLNQHLAELPGVEDLFVAPNMGDGGNAVGALCEAGLLRLDGLPHVFLGTEYSDSQLQDCLAGRTYTRPENPAQCAAEAIADGKLVGRFAGRMEWGPRALGNRSILALPSQKAVVDRLNSKLKRSDFMPFAPAMLDEEAERFLQSPGQARHAAEYMTVCFNCTPEMNKLFPAVVHVDGTARAQLVRQASNPGFHAILTELKALTGAGVVLNTSFNMHEEPIVESPQDALSAFDRAGLDYLALGPYWVQRRDCDN
jgi:carbamoyltransferase